MGNTVFSTEISPWFSSDLKKDTVNFFLSLKPIAIYQSLCYMFSIILFNNFIKSYFAYDANK